MTSYYGLLSTQDINSPQPSDGWMQVPFYTGYNYAAYPARTKEEVEVINIWISLLNKMIQKAGTFTLFNERPAMLIYHEKCFHLLDLKVKQIICLVDL